MADETGLTLSDDPRINTTLSGINDVCVSYKPGIQYLGRYPPSAFQTLRSDTSATSTLTYILSLPADQLVDFERSHLRIKCRAYRVATAAPTVPVPLNYDTTVAQRNRQLVTTSINPFMTDIFEVSDLTVSGQTVEHNQFSYLRSRAMTALIPKENVDKYYSDCYFLPFEDQPEYYAVAGTAGGANNLTEFPAYVDDDGHQAPARVRGLSLAVRNSEANANTDPSLIVEFTKRVPLSFLFAFGEKNLMPGTTSMNIALQINLRNMLTQIGASPAGFSDPIFELQSSDLYLYGYRMTSKIMEMYDRPFEVLVNTPSYVAPQGINSSQFNYSGSLPPMCNMICAEFFCNNANIVGSRALGASYLPSREATLLINMDGQQYPPITLPVRSTALRPARPTSFGINAGGNNLGSSSEVSRMEADDTYVWFENYNFAKTLGNAGTQAANVNGVLFDKDAFGSSQFRMYIMVNGLPGAMSIDNRAISFTMSLTFSQTATDVVPGHVAGEIQTKNHSMSLTYFSTNILKWSPDMRTFVPRLRST